MENVLPLRLISVVLDGPALAASWALRHRSRRALRRLDARLLADIGLSEADQNRESRKWFWQA